MISASLVKELREATGAGMLDCKKALEASNGNIEEAITWLREKGISKAAKKASRIAAEGLAVAKVEGNKAVVLEVNSETDFVAKNEEFVKLVDTIANAVLASDVNTVEDAMKLTVDGKTVEELIVDKTATIGEKLSFRRFEVVTKEDSQVFGTYSHMGGKIIALTVLTDVINPIPANAHNIALFLFIIPITSHCIKIISFLMNYFYVIYFYILQYYTMKTYSKYLIVEFCNFSVMYFPNKYNHILKQP